MKNKKNELTDADASKKYLKLFLESNNINDCEFYLTCLLHLNEFDEVIEEYFVKNIIPTGMTTVGIDPISGGGSLAKVNSIVDEIKIKINKINELIK